MITYYSASQERYWNKDVYWYYKHTGSLHIYIILCLLHFLKSSPFHLLIMRLFIYINLTEQTSTVKQIQAITRIQEITSMDSLNNLKMLSDIQAHVSSLHVYIIYIVTRSLEINPGSTQKLTGISFLIRRNCRSVVVTEILLRNPFSITFPFGTIPL